MHKKPSILDGQKVFYISSAYPPALGGSSVINRNLLSYFDEDSYVLLKANRKTGKGFAGFIPKHTYNLALYYDRLPRKLVHAISMLQISLARRKMIRLCKHYKPAVIVCAFPNYYFLKVARDVAKLQNIPLVIYLHDTIAEALKSSKELGEKAAELQEQVFSEAKTILVMSEGMQHLYKEKYNLDTTPLVHSYTEAIPKDPTTYSYNKTALWGGNIYAINRRSIQRINNALSGLGFEYHIAQQTTTEDLAGIGIEGEHLKIVFYGERVDYIQAVEQAGILTLALDWPDESAVHQDELATIFPTKTIEYLASGGLILVHCPESYFMAKFIKKHECGIVVTERSVDAVKKEIQRVLASPEIINTYRKNALKTAQLFSIEHVAPLFSQYLNEALNV